MADRTPLQRKLIRWFAYPPEAVGAYLLYGILRILPMNVASAFGGWLLRRVGPRLRAERIARRNLRNTWPELDDAEIDAVMRHVWDNLGRLLGEWPHLGAWYKAGFNGRVEIVGREHAERIAAAGGPAIVITGHFGNWELAGAVCSMLGMPLKVIFRPAQNVWVNRLIVFTRRHFTGGILPKGKDAAAGALRHLRDGKVLGVLIDQKLNEGIAIPFLERDAMTSPVAARLALRFRCPVLPVRAERIQGTRYRVTFYPPMELPDSGDKNRDLESLMLDMNRMLEGWIRERPEQWFWVHKRWPD